MSENQKPYSYHTFIFPFSWKAEHNDFLSFVEYFDKNQFWTNTDMADSNEIDSAKTIDSEQLLLYKEYQYFYPYVRKAIYGFDEHIVRSYSFMHDELHNKAKYYISKGDNNYELDINAVRLKIYNTHVAFFILECENKKEGQDNLTAYLNINDYGRRITLPYIPAPGGYSVSADSLKIKIDDISFESDFKAFIDSKDKKISMNHTSDIIKDILQFGSDGKRLFSSHKAKDDKTFWIYPLLGDRMFTISAVIDQEIENLLKKGLHYFDSDEAKKVYEIAYVDNAGGCSCQDTEMLKKLIEEAVSRRWLNYSTAHFITNYSMTLVMNGYEDHVVESFITQYYQMFCLAIAQRATIMQFKREIAALSHGFETKNNVISDKIVNKIMNLQERYSAFEAQLYYDEVTPEQQGIEIYDMIKKQFFIENEMSSLANQIERLNNAANTYTNSRSGEMMNALTWIAFFVSIASMVISSFQINGFRNLTNSDGFVVSTNGVPLNGIALMLTNVQWDAFWVISSGVLVFIMCICFILKAKKK